MLEGIHFGCLFQGVVMLDYVLGCDASRPLAFKKVVGLIMGVGWRSAGLRGVVSSKYHPFSRFACPGVVICSYETNELSHPIILPSGLQRACLIRADPMSRAFRSFAILFQKKNLAALRSEQGKRSLDNKGLEAWKIMQISDKDKALPKRSVAADCLNDLDA
ncbi:hypothetical protein BDZ45DRAFT_735914 [Acephala macrosclerotiorum]|nr:hypothetical protein BDZ45DRAFT_735914 [Acephala macrosclerotiorum]